MAEYFNPQLTEQIPDGATGKQAYYAIFYTDRVGLWTRLTQAEGHEVALNPETEEKNTIGMLQAETVVKQYKVQFDKEIIIEKGELNYEFFYRFYEMKYTGKNARLNIMLVDMMKSVPGASGYQDCLAYVMPMTITVTTYGATDAKLNVHFDQSGDAVRGLAINENATEHPVFTPSNDIAITRVILSKTGTVSVKAGKDLWVSVDFEPFGCPNDFTVALEAPATMSDYCSAERIRDSAVIHGLKAGTARVIIASVADPLQTETLAVTVTA